jgi:hypothetical protein
MVDRWRRNPGTGHASLPAVCVAPNVCDWGWFSEVDDWWGEISSVSAGEPERELECG